MMKSRTEISGSSGSFLSIEACDLLDEVKTLKEDGWPVQTGWTME